MNQGIRIINEKKEIYVQSAFPIFPSFQNFSVLATTNGQGSFTLPSNPVLTGLFSLNKNGTEQDELAGDFTVSGNLVTVNDSNVFIGDKWSGFYQQMASNVNPAFVNYRTFFYVATQGQISFTLSFIPKAIIYISVNGVIESTNDYSISGGIITLTSPLNFGDNFFGLAIQ